MQSHGGHQPVTPGGHMFPHGTSLVLPDPPHVITLWITTVDVDTIDHNPTTVVALRKDTHYTIVPLYNGKPMFAAAPTSLVYVGNMFNNNMTIYMSVSLILEKVCDKVMISNRGTNAHVQITFVVPNTDGVGMILTNTTVNDVAYAHIISSTGTSQKTGNTLRAYTMSDPNPMTNIVLAGTKVDIQLFPIVAAFPL
jgi:hypothetical protein